MKKRYDISWVDSETAQIFDTTTGKEICVVGAFENSGLGVAARARLVKKALNDMDSRRRCHLLDMEAMKRLAPIHFESCPDRRTTARLRPGAIVRLLFVAGGAQERLWVQVRSRTRTGYRGELMDAPRQVPLRQHDVVSFRPEHVMTAL